MENGKHTLMISLLIGEFIFLFRTSGLSVQRLEEVYDGQPPSHASNHKRECVNMLLQVGEPEKSER